MAVEGQCNEGQGQAAWGPPDGSSAGPPSRSACPVSRPPRRRRRYRPRARHGRCPCRSQTPPVGVHGRRSTVQPQPCLSTAAASPARWTSVARIMSTAVASKLSAVSPYHWPLPPLPASPVETDGRAAGAPPCCMLPRPPRRPYIINNRNLVPRGPSRNLVPRGPPHNPPAC